VSGRFVQFVDLVPERCLLLAASGSKILGVGVRIHGFHVELMHGKGDDRVARHDWRSH
jgi:hypothetical protein